VIGGQRLALGEVVSTQEELTRLALAGAPEGTVVTADHQTGGRGRRGRTWWDGPAENLLMSVLLRPPIAISQAPQLSLVAAVAVVDALHATAGVRVGIRWPNDVLAGGRKLCGILSEAVAGAEGRLQHVLLGIGINVNQTEFHEAIREVATSLRLVTGRREDRTRILDGLLEALDRRYAQFLGGDFAAIRSDWRRHSLSLGRLVRTSDGEEAEALDVDESGALIVRGPDGAERRLSSGEVTGAPAA
jgi:BirA family biotin operon repressor/biotin-[acetyl-CoA-carboxylase] ligase